MCAVFQALQRITRSPHYKLTTKHWDVELCAVLGAGTFFTIQATTMGVVYALSSQDDIDEMDEANNRVYASKDQLRADNSTMVTEMLVRHSLHLCHHTFLYVRDV